MRSLPRPRLAALLLFAPLIVNVGVASRAAAQEVTGAIQGTIISPEGTPEPEVHFTLSGPNLQGSRETSSDRHGFFQFLAVPPGTYELHVGRIGFRPIEVRGVLVELGRTTAVPPLTLDPQPIKLESVEVLAPRIRIDPVHAAAGGTLDAKDYAALPVDRDYKSIIALLPLANQSYRGDPVNVGGSTGLENQYYVDGVNVTDTKTAERATSLPSNFVRAIDVKTAGYEAQYGRALGAVVNALTYSGTNDLEMNVFGFVQPSGLAMDPRVATAVAEAGAVSYDVGARASGPMVRDRLWYSTAGNPRVDQVDKEITGHGSFTDRTAGVRFASKLTWRASSATNLELSVFGDPTVRDRVDPLPAGVTSVTDPDALLARVESGGVVASLRATVALDRAFLLQTSVARQWDRYSNLGATPSGKSEEAYVDYVEGSIGGGRTLQQEEDRGRTSLAARGTLTLTRHTVIAGADYEDARVYSSAVVRQTSRIDTTTYFRDLEAYSGTFHNRSPAVYLQDNWRLTDRFTLNPGLRWSGQYLAGASGRTAQRITDEWQPRVGFSWQLGRVNTQRLFGSYGRFYQTVPTNIAVLWYVDYFATYSYYSSDPRQPGAVPDTVIDGSTLEADYAKQIPGLQAENSDEVTLGYERLLGTETKLTIRGIRRNLRSSFQWGLDFSRNPIWAFGTPGKGDFDFLPPPKRQHTALEISAEGAWRQFQYRTSYVLSRSWGNYPGLYNSDFSISNPGGIWTFFTPYQAQNSTGFLPNDQTHVFKLSGTYATGLGLLGGVFLTYGSGTPINDFAGVPPLGPMFPSFLIPRGTAGRAPALWDLNLRLAYEIRVVRGPRTQFQLDLLHIGDPQRAIQVDETHYATLDANGNPASPNPSYGQPIAYQPPMAARLGIEVSF